MLRFILIGCERGTTLLPDLVLVEGDDGCTILLWDGTGIGSEIGRKHGRGGLTASLLVCLIYLTIWGEKFRYRPKQTSSVCRNIIEVHTLLVAYLDYCLCHC